MAASKRSGEAGFSLLELMLAALLLSSSVAALFGAFVTASRWMKSDFSAGAYLGAIRLESLYECVRSDWWSQNDKPLSPAGTVTDGTVTQDGVVYTRTYTVTPVTGRDYRKAEVKVTWP